MTNIEKYFDALKKWRDAEEKDITFIANYYERKMETILEKLTADEITYIEKYGA